MGEDLSGIEALNATFLDLEIQRWELRIERQILLRHGSSLVDTSIPQDLDAWQAEVGRVEAGLEALRKEAKTLGAAFPLDQIVEIHGLNPLESEILRLALMPMLDLSFRNRIARYNNNILFDHVDVALALNLLLPDSRMERLHGQELFSGEGRLIRERLLVMRAPKEPRGSGTLALELSPPTRLADRVLGRRSLDQTLTNVATLETSERSLDTVVLPSGAREALCELLSHLKNHEEPPPPFALGDGLTVSIMGGSGTGKSACVMGLAHHLGRPVISVNCSALRDLRLTSFDPVEALFAEARVQGAVLVLDGCEAILDAGSPRLSGILGELERAGGLTILVSGRPDDVDSSVERYVAWEVNLDMPDVGARQAIWEALQPPELTLDDEVDLADLATRFEITGGQIAQAWEVAARRATAEGQPPNMQSLRDAAHAQIRARMEDYSVRSKVNLTLEDLVVPDKERGLIEEVLEACRNRVFVMSKWGFGERLVTGKGICVLFKGEPGTGKTLCAEILASELGMKLYQISIPKIVSKYIGETEKNIAKIFSSARANHSMLLFDEADSLFTKRVSVENAVDRFSNMETNLLLQEIERFEGITILTTNLDKNIDDAFSRRIQFKIDFPFPEPDYRSKIWSKLIPAECPVDDDLDLEELGRNFELSGGYIKNAVVRAAYRAAAGPKRITREEILFAAEQECRNAGKIFRNPSDEDDW